MSNPNPSRKGFQKGNQFHNIIPNTGRPKLFATPEDLWAAACKYFEYCVDNPLPYYTHRYRKQVKRYRMQPMSLQALAMYIGVSSLQYYRRLPGFSEVTDRIDDVLYVHNFSGAATNLLKYKVVRHNRLR